MLSAALVDGYPHLFYAENICHLYRLFASIKTIVNATVKSCKHLAYDLTPPFSLIVGQVFARLNCILLSWTMHIKITL